MKLSIVMCFVSAAFLCAGCSSLTSPARLHKLEPGSSYWFDYDASRRGTVLTTSADANGRTIVKACSEPAPDIAYQMIAEAQLKLSQPTTQSASVGGSGAQAAQVLSERSQMVLFFREALFRVCEISMNQQIPPADLAKLYESIIHTALRLGSDKAFEVDLAKLLIERTALETELLLARERESLAKAALANANTAKDAQARLAAQASLDEAQKNQQRASADLQKVNQQFINQLASPGGSLSASQEGRALQTESGARTEPH